MFFAFICLLMLLFYVVHKWATAKYDIFKKRGIPYDKPIPLLGSMKDAVLRRKSIFEVLLELYKKHDGKVFGIFNQRDPVLIVRDPEIIKRVLVKDFDHFVNHAALFKERKSDVFVNTIFFLCDKKWKDMRISMNPGFTGNMLRHMFDLINEVAFTSTEFLQNSAEITDTGLELNLKDFSTRYTCDVIASTAFGIEINSLKNKDNEFYRMCLGITHIDMWKTFKLFLNANFGWFLKFFNISIMDMSACEYFRCLVLDAINNRKQCNTQRSDMIDVLMEGLNLTEKKNAESHNRQWSDVDLAAQCIFFFMAAFESVSVLICFALQEIMADVSIQQKLYEEIRKVSVDSNSGRVSFDELSGMKYLDTVVSETLRKWPPTPILDRVAGKDFVYETTDGEHFEIKKGDLIWITVSGLHRDPQYFPNPNKFDPERFSENNKTNITPFTYLPFGIGPRHCIGYRFAILEAKAIIFYMVRQFELVPAAKTVVLMDLVANGFQLAPKNGFWLKLIPRKK